MKIKIILFIIGVISFCFLDAQTLHFTYDAAGNLTCRSSVDKYLDVKKPTFSGGAVPGYVYGLNSSIWLGNYVYSISNDWRRNLLNPKK